MTDPHARSLSSLLLVFAISFASLAFAAELPQLPARPAVRRASATEPATPEAAPAAAPPSDAERISRLDRSLEADEKRLAELKATVNAPDNESAEAQREFEELDAQLTAKRKQREQMGKYAPPRDERRLGEEIAALEKKRGLARDRFDLAIRGHKAERESITALEQKIAHDREALAELRGSAAAAPPRADAPPQASTATLGEAPAHAEPTASAKAPASNPAATKSPPAVAATPSTAHEAGPHMADPDAEKKEEDDAELATATAEAQKAEAAADEAEEEEKSLTERIAILEKNIALARDLRDTAHQKVDNADETLKALNQELFRKLVERANVDEVKQQIQEATERVREARAESRSAARDLDELQSSLAALQAEELAAAADADKKRQAADEAAEVVKDLNNPFTVHNLLQWLLDHGPRMLGILLAVGVAIRLSRVVETRLISLIASRGRIGNRLERENRAKTLLGIFHNAANILILGGGTVVLLDEVGIPVAPLIGGAAVIGLAVAFGAQSLIKDYFTGFLVLLEQQYLVNDIVKIGQITGQVERITLRTTALRDTEGHLHFIPHGQISTVTNTTHGWSRAVFEVRVSYRENVDHVIELLTQLAKEMTAAEPYRAMILDEAVTPGIDSLTDAGVVIKFTVKTRPLQTSKVKRELLRRIKNKFDEQGIEIPHPQLMVYRRDDSKFGVVGDKRRAG